MIIYRGHELTKDQKGWWIWLKDTRVNDRAISSEQQAKVWIDMRKTEEVQRKAALDPMALPSEARRAVGRGGPRL